MPAAENATQTAGGVMVILVRCVAIMAAGIVLIQNPSARADDYPNRSIMLIVPWAPGGAVDTVARIIAPKLSERLGKTVVIENRGGAGSTLGTGIGAKAAPDGSTLGMPGSGSLAIAPTMYKSLPYDPNKDFAPMALVGRVPVKTVAELIAYAKDHKLFYASGGAGSPHHIYAEMFQGMTVSR
jgi:tripartite-type tricarboxylate transporter receptor subunit TctC